MGKFWGADATRTSHICPLFRTIYFPTAPTSTLDNFLIVSDIITSLISQAVFPYLQMSTFRHQMQLVRVAAYTASLPPSYLRFHLREYLLPSVRKWKVLRLVLCQEKVQIKCNQFSLFLAKFNLQSLLHSFRGFRDIVPHIHLETNIHNDCECVLYYKMFRCIQKPICMHVHN